MTSASSVDLWQVEVGEQGVDGDEAVWRRDEQGGAAFARAHDAVLARGGLEGAHHGGPDGDDRTPFGPRGGDGLGRLLRDVPPLFVHRVVFEPLDLDRREGAGPDVQGDAREPVASGFERLEQTGGQVQTRRGGRDCTGPGCIHGLVARAIGRSRGPADVGRQGHLATGVDGFRDGRGPRRPERHIDRPPIGARLDPRLEQARGEGASLPRAEPLRRATERAPPLLGPAATDPLEEQQLHPSTGRLVAAQPRRDDAGVVDHQERRWEQRREIAHTLVMEAAARPIEDEQAAAVTLGRRLGRDQGFGKFVVELT